MGGERGEGFLLFGGRGWLYDMIFERGRGDGGWGGVDGSGWVGSDLADLVWCDVYGGEKKA